jgi:hypothetical protein
LIIVLAGRDRSAGRTSATPLVDRAGLVYLTMVPFIAEAASKRLI